MHTRHAVLLTPSKAARLSLPSCGAENAFRASNAPAGRRNPLLADDYCLKSFRCNTYKKQGVGVPPHLRAIRTLPPKASFIELLCFQILAPSFPRRRTLKCFLFNGFRTLSITTGGRGTQSHIASHQPAPTVSGSQVTLNYIRRPS